jgi:two-component system, OmpR family, response regulator ChvI
MKAVVTLQAGVPVLLASVSEEPDDALRVLFIEDGAIDGGFLTDKLSQQGIVVRTVASLAGAYDAACDADVIVLHCKRVNNSSIELLGKLRAPGLDIPAVLLTGEAAPAYECLALDKGAIDVILTSRGPDVLARRLKGVVKTIGRTDRPRSGRAMKCGKLLLRPGTGRAYWKGLDVGLTLGGYNIVHLLASNVGQYLTYRAIYDRLHYEGFLAGGGAYGYRVNVRSVIKRIRNHFRALDPTFDHIENYAGFGYCWKKPD